MPRQKLMSTGLVPDDDDPMFDDDGYTTITPEFDEAEMLEALEDPAPTDVESELPPQEAYDTMKFMAPLSEAEIDILRTTPFLTKDMTWVDDPVHTEEIIERSRDGYKGMDHVLEDQMYGERKMSEEEKVEQAGSDSFGDDNIEGFGNGVPPSSSVFGFGNGVPPSSSVFGFGNGIPPEAIVLGELIESGMLTSGEVQAMIDNGLISGDELGGWNPLKKVVSAARAVGSGVKAVGSQAWNTAKGAAKIAHKIAMLPTQVALRIAKEVAKVAAYPIKRAARPLISNTAMLLARKGGRTRPSHADFAQANKISIAAMNRSSNPMVKFGGKVLGFVGTGVSGERADASVVGMTGAEIAILAAASAAAIFAAMAALKKTAAAAVGPVPEQDPSMMQPGMDPSMMDPSMMQPGAPTESYPDAGYPEEAYDPGMYGDDAESGRLYKSIVDPLADMDGEEFVACDSTLGQFTGHVFSGADKLSEKVHKEDAQLKALTIAAKKGDLQAQNLLKMVAAAERIKKQVVSSEGEEREIAKVKAAKHKGQLKLLAQAAEAGDAQALALLQLFAAASRSQERVLATKAATESETQGDDELGLDPFLHKLNPMYWIKSGREKNLIDLEKKYAADREDTEKKLRDQRKELNYGEAAARAEQMAKEARQESIDIENRVRAIESTVKGRGNMEMGGRGNVEMGGRGNVEMGKARAAVVAKVVAKARRNGKVAGELAKRAAKRPLNTGERVVLRGVIKSNKALAKLAPGKSKTGYHETTSFKSDFLGENPTEILGGELPVEILGGELPVEILGAAAPAQKIPDKIWIAMAAVAAKNPKNLNAMARKYNIVLNTAQKGHLQNIVALTRAQMKKAMIKAAVKGGATKEDLMGVSFGQVAKGVGTAVTLPFAAAAYGTYKALQYGKQKLFGGGGGGPPSPQALYAANEKARLARMQAAQQRKIAALKRSVAADAITEKARAEATLAADAADAEAEARSAEAETLEMQNLAQEAAVRPGMTEADKEEYYDESNGPGWFSGGWTDEIRNEKVKKIVAAAAGDNVVGVKVRSGAAVYSKAKKGDRKARVAVKKVQMQAARGSVQAKADMNALRAGRVAVEAKRKALRKQRSKQRVSKISARRAAWERALGNKLARTSRRKQFEKLAKLEAAAARGNKKAVVLVKKQVVAAKRGNKRAATNVAAMKVAREVRRKATTPLERKNLRNANKFYARVRRGNKKAVRQLAVVRSAAAKGQPNAKRAMGRLQTVAKVNKVIDTGKVAAAGTAGLGIGFAAKKKKKAEIISCFDRLNKKVKKKTATQEEAFEAARLAQQLGNKKEAGQIALQAESLPSATTELKKTATVAAASQAGNKEAKEAVKETLQAAASGDPAGIRGAGELEAVRSLDAVNHGRAMPKEVAKAVDLVERAQQNDPVAKEAIEKATIAAQQDNPHADAIKAAVALTAAGTVASALASKPTAKQQWIDEAAKARGEKPRGTTFTREPVRVPFDQTDVLSSLPEQALSPINSVGELVRESLKAILLSTNDPLQNYREGLVSRGESWTRASTSGKEAPGDVAVEKEKKRQLLRASVWKALGNEKNQSKSDLMEAANILRKLNFPSDVAKVEKAAQKLQS